MKPAGVQREEGEAKKLMSATFSDSSLEIGHLSFSLSIPLVLSLYGKRNGLTRL